jgi:hypothetical protein
MLYLDNSRGDSLSNFSGDELEMAKDPEIQREIQRSMNRLKIQKDSAV